MKNQRKDERETEVRFSGNVGRVTSVTNVNPGVVAVPATEDEAAVFTRADFEDALDKVSRPVKGKYAHVPYSSEDLIRDKRKEAELEDR